MKKIALAVSAAILGVFAWAQDAGTWAKAGDEWSTFAVEGTKQVRFGKGTAWIERSLSGTVECNRNFFGGDPASGVYKQCDVYTPPATVTTGTWAKAADEWGNFALTGTQKVRFGKGTLWVEKTLSGTVECNRNFFGSDPAPGVYKQCDLFTPDTTTPPPETTPPPATTSNLPYVDISKIPAAVTGFSVDRVSATTELPGNSDGTGAFRTVCAPSHSVFDDPLVFPGQPGKSHLHTFFGNTATNAYSTADSIATTGNSTCRGGTVNRSSYWVPAMIDTRTGAMIQPAESHFYYKSGYGVFGKHAQIKPFPTGLRMIAGDSKRTAPSGPYDSVYGFICGDTTKRVLSECPSTGEIRMTVDFPQCWDGVNLDSPDHKSHMAYPSNNSCPASHPVIGPHISFNIVFFNLPTQYARLSSDINGNPSGITAHGDWVNGWKADIMQAWVAGCLNVAKDCHSNLLGDGRTIY